MVNKKLSEMQVMLLKASPAAHKKLVHLIVDRSTPGKRVTIREMLDKMILEDKKFSDL